jgi:hypothetical protein
LRCPVFKEIAIQRLVHKGPRGSNIKGSLLWFGSEGLLSIGIFNPRSAHAAQRNSVGAAESCVTTTSGYPETKEPFLQRKRD